MSELPLGAMHVNQNNKSRHIDAPHLAKLGIAGGENTNKISFNKAPTIYEDTIRTFLVGRHWHISS